MSKRVRESVAEEQSAGKGQRSREDEDEVCRSEDWCFICKDGGKLLLCSHKECAKAYHIRCLKEKKLSVPSSKLSWHCSRHTCSKCQDRSIFFCYCCPTAICHNCMGAIYFLLVKKQYGFCHECRRRALSLENEKVELECLSRSNRLFMEYYEIVKKDEGLTLKDLQSPEEQTELKQKHKSSGSDIVEVQEKDEKVIRLKRFNGQQNRKLNSSEKSQNDALVCKAPETVFPSIVPDNINLVYLKRSLVQQLLEEPESFEGKIIGSYVRVKSSPSDGYRSNSYQLMQVIGVKKASCGQDTDIKLQAVDMSNDISINSLSDANFSEEECEYLNQKMKVGLLKKPTLDELVEKAKSLHKDVTKHRLAREMRVLESKIVNANEKGRKHIVRQLLDEKKQLEDSSYWGLLLGTPPKVIAEPPETSNGLTDASKLESISEDTDKEKKTNGSPRFIPIYNEWVCRKTASATSIGDVDLDELLDQLIKPDVSCSSVDDDSFEAIKQVEKALIVLLKKVPISDLKSMITVANGSFMGLKCVLRINYSSLYERVRNYIRCSSLLASTEQFKQGLSMEELAANYYEGNKYNQMVQKCMKQLSTYFSEVRGISEVQISEKEQLLVKLEAEHSLCGTEHQSRNLREMSEKMQKSLDELMHDSETFLKSKNYFAEAWEGFVSAKTALGL